MSDALRLFAVMVGGAHKRANIELHDVQFVVARSIEETIPTLRARWWGTPSSLHIDAYAELCVVDGHTITPVAAAAKRTGGPQLFFVNTGGYTPGVFNELHAFSFHVGENKAAIWSAARARAAFASKHKDNLDTIDDVISVDEALGEQRFSIALEPSPGAADDVRIAAKYIKL